jgi:hypothetical protein
MASHLKLSPRLCNPRLIYPAGSDRHTIGGRINYDLFINISGGS